MIVERNKYLNQLLESRHNGLTKVITGIRRSGKSFLLFNLLKNRLIDEGTDREHIIEMLTCMSRAAMHVSFQDKTEVHCACHIRLKLGFYEFHLRGTDFD